MPQAWIDVRSMADLDDVATAFRHRHDRKMRVATKYVNLTRDFFAGHGIVDYRIVESSGATEGAPAAGTAELIVDITTTGTTLAANALKIVDDGVILRSQANLVASRGAPMGRRRARRHARSFSIASRRRRGRAPFAKCARALRNCNDDLLGELRNRFGVVTPFGGPTSSGMLTLHCPSGKVHALASILREKGAESIVVAQIDYVFAPDNPLYAKLIDGRRAERAFQDLFRNTTKCDSEKFTRKLAAIAQALAAASCKPGSAISRGIRPTAAISTVVLTTRPARPEARNVAIGPPAQLRRRIRGKGDERVQHVGAGDRDQPGQHVGRQSSGAPRYCTATQNTPKSITELTTPTARSSIAFRISGALAPGRRAARCSRDGDGFIGTA